MLLQAAQRSLCAPSLHHSERVKQNQRLGFARRHHTKCVVCDCTALCSKAERDFHSLLKSPFSRHCGRPARRSSVAAMEPAPSEPLPPPTNIMQYLQRMNDAEQAALYQDQFTALTVFRCDPCCQQASHPFIVSLVHAVFFNTCLCPNSPLGSYWMQSTASSREAVCDANAVRGPSDGQDA